MRMILTLSRIFFGVDMALGFLSYAGCSWLAGQRFSFLFLFLSIFSTHFPDADMIPYLLFRKRYRLVSHWVFGHHPYHTQVFVLTNHPRAPLVMEGGTTFHFVTDGIHVALERARDAANGKDVRIGGGAATIRQYLQERLIDELHIAIAPVLLGAGEWLFEDIKLPDLGYTCTQHIPTQRATHIVLTRT